MNKKIIIGVVVLLAIVLYINPFSSKGDGSIEISTIKLERKDLSSKVVADGVLQPEIEIKLSSNTTTYITEIAVQEGDIVKKGDYLMIKGSNSTGLNSITKKLITGRNYAL